MFINFINAEGGNTEELEQQISALTQELTDVTDEYASVIDRSATEITIPSGTTTIGESAFNGCSAITDATITSDVSNIKSKSFANNKSLTTITFEGDTPPTIAPDAFSMLPKDIEVVVPEGQEDAYSGVVETIEENTIPWVTATDDPSTGGSAYTFTYADGTVNAYAFNRWGSVKVEMSNNITHIGYCSFNAMWVLSSLTLSTGITAIESYGLGNLSSLRNGVHIYLPSIETIYAHGFTNCAFDSIEFGENLENLAADAVSSTELTGVTFHTAHPSAITYADNAIMTSQTNGEIRLDTGKTGFDLTAWAIWKATKFDKPSWKLCDLEGNELSVPAMIILTSGNTQTVLTPSSTTVSSSDMPTGTFDKIMTVGMETLDDNCFINTQAIEYYFDAALTKSKCSPIWGPNPVKITFASDNLDLNNFDARLFSTAWGNPPVSSITFYNSVCPTKYIEYGSLNSAASAGTLYVPVGSEGWHNLLISGLTSAWTVADVANTAHTLGCVITTTSASTDSYWCYGSPGNARYVFNTGIISAEIKNLDNSGGQTFQGCTNLSAVTIGTKADGGNIRIEGNFCYGCSALTNIVCYGSSFNLDYESGGWFDGVASGGTLCVDTDNPNYDYWTWQVEMSEAGISDWTLCDLSGNPVSEPLCEIHDAYNIMDCGCFVESGSTPAPIRMEFSDSQTLTIVDGRILYMQPVGEFSVNYDDVNDQIVIIDNTSQQPVSQQVQEQIDGYLGISGFEKDGNYYIQYDFFDVSDVSVDDDDFTGIYADCMCI